MLHTTSGRRFMASNTRGWTAAVCAPSPLLIPRKQHEVGRSLSINLLQPEPVTITDNAKTYNNHIYFINRFQTGREQLIAKILVTGATGFVGSHILQALMTIEHKDLQIVAACRDTSKLLPQYAGEVRVGDLRDPDYLDRLLAGIDIICHAAGWSSFEKSARHCNQAYLEPTLDLINRAIEWRVSRFVNLSSLFAASATLRNNMDAPGKPRAYWPMMNCLIAVEDYLRAYNNSRCQFVNLRPGIYSGKRLKMGLLPLLLARSGQSRLPYINDKLGFFPLVDGRDIGQAFARAALAPFDASYSCLNIAGPMVPTQAEVMDFIQQQMAYKPLSWGLPSALASPVLWLNCQWQRLEKHPQFTTAMLDMLKSPLIDNLPASQLLGYDPETGWQASLLNTIEGYKNQSLNTCLSQPYRDLNLS